MRKGPPYGRVLPLSGGTTLKALLNTPRSAERLYPYRWPLAGHIRVTCEFGARDNMHNDSRHPRGHGGIDLGAVPGTSVLAARDGRVLYSGAATGYGHWVILRHADGQLSIYGHVSAHHIAHVGKDVKVGDVIAAVGTASEGHTNGPHLHFQINNANTGVGSAGAINPRLVLPPPI